ncbi:hypothetical protein DFP72DRAFT_898690 [Ephemerocybe angulata]|uniref:MYND-type domain-containing protein n=1 Tax=Ephemerocybe angulata TaxID=980116 RepID=A0A8H6HYP4_9AGAR|nr:hypothetical protein DFP72DRAFT_898690 [Tulosesus angulatus]
MAQLCQSEPLWSYSDFAESLDTLGGIIEAFRSHEFLYHFMLLIHSFVRSLDPGTISVFLMVAREAVMNLQEWVDIPGVAETTTKAVRQLIKGGLLSVYLSFLIQKQSMLGTFERACGDLGQWIVNYSFYPSVHIAIMDGLSPSRIDQKQLLELFKRNDGHWTRQQWVALSCPLYSLGRQGLKYSKGNAFGICDNIFVRLSIFLHPQEDGKAHMSRECSGCHMSIYCSKECQLEDWKRSRHQDDCVHLAKFYTQQLENHSLLHSSTRMFQLAVLQESYRRCMKDGVPESLKQKSDVGDSGPLSELIICFNFIDSPAIRPESTPTLKRTSELSKLVISDSAAQGLSKRRLEGLLKSSTEGGNVQLVEGRFKLRELTRYVLARLRIFVGDDGTENPELATVLGGTSWDLVEQLSEPGAHRRKARERMYAAL